MYNTVNTIPYPGRTRRRSLFRKVIGLVRSCMVLRCGSQQYPSHLLEPTAIDKIYFDQIKIG